MNTKCALVVGHRFSEKGAINKTLFAKESPISFDDFDSINIFLQNRIEQEDCSVSEFDFNDILARLISQYVEKTYIDIIYRDDFENGYNNLPQKINNHNPHFIISLHNNKIKNKKIYGGIETLYYHSCDIGQNIAKILQEELEFFFDFESLGINPTKQNENGGYILSQTKAPCVISKPFFIDNDFELATALYNLDNLAKMYANTIDKISMEIFENTKKVELKAKELPTNFLNKLKKS